MITHQSSLENFHNQLTYVQKNYVPHGLQASSFSHVLIGGLGGSGIGGVIAKTWFSNRFPIPVEVVNNYELPGYINEKSLVILSSYSGNTEETLAMFEEAVSRKATVLVVSAGGRLTELAKEKGLLYYPVETGYQPRMALGYSLGFLLRILAELIGEDVHADMEAAADKLKHNDHLKQTAINLQQKFQGSLNRRYTILSDAAFYGIAVRFAQQLNENAKQEAFVNLLPEANHNVIESYYGQLPSNFIVLNSNSNERISSRFDFVTALLERENNKVAIIETETFTLSTLFEVIHLLDWFSVNIAEPLSVDPMEIENIMSLKEFLSE
jgi:glucose/mannose-6-phosphate isomerase